MCKISDGPTIKVGVIGATGTVGQRFITLLANHEWFAIHALGASARSAGKPYSKATNWKQTTPIPSIVRDMVVHECQPEHFKDCAIVFSGLDADVAGELGKRPLRSLICFAHVRTADLAVFSNAKNYRRDPFVPLIVPLVNTSHLAMITQQQALHDPPLKKGFILTNANCSTTGLVIPLRALEKAFGPDRVTPAYPASTSSTTSFLTLAAKRKKWNGRHSRFSEIWWMGMMGLKAFDMRARQPLRVSASCNRVPVIDGHLMTVSVRFARRPPPSPQQVREALVAYAPDAPACPSAPVHAIFVHEESDRPQPRLDRYYQDGAGVSVGRVRQCPVLDVKFVVLANNVSIGAATSSIINAELAVLRGVVH
ncbi:aspartate-semialdehyde dehydrogenase [Butyriboletus roseoflavus]|nr:aspartate-semialdehyde dehydrogenase [Butyriboletus roseoflavus]